MVSILGSASPLVRLVLLVVVRVVLVLKVSLVAIDGRKRRDEGPVVRPMDVRFARLGRRIARLAWP